MHRARGDTPVPRQRLTPFDELIGELRSPTDWRTIGPADAAQAWDQLREWVTWFKDRYALDHRVVPPCWYLHPALVDLLTALRDHHHHAHSDTALATDALAWQRAFAETEPRLRDWASRTSCPSDQHRDDLTAAWPADTERWDAHVNRDRTERIRREQAQRLD